MVLKDKQHWTFFPSGVYCTVYAEQVTEAAKHKARLYMLCRSWLPDIIYGESKQLGCLGKLSFV